MFLLLIFGLSTMPIADGTAGSVRCHCNPSYSVSDMPSVNDLIESRLAANLTEANRILSSASCADSQFCLIHPTNGDPKKRLRPVCAYEDQFEETNNNLAHTIHCAFLEVPASETEGCSRKKDSAVIYRFCTSDNCNNRPIDCQKGFVPKAAGHLGPNTLAVTVAVWLSVTMLR